NQIVALIDGRDSFDPASIHESFLSRLLWIRCHSAPEALKAADLVLRDDNLPLVLLDLGLNPETKRIPATTWYRFQRLIEETATVCLVFTPCPLISCAQARITVRSRFSLDALEADVADVL